MTLEEHFINKGFQIGFQQGLQEGRQKILVAVAQKMLAQGITLDLVRTCTGLPLQKLQELAQSLTQNSASKSAQVIV